MELLEIKNIWNKKIHWIVLIAVIHCRRKDP